VSESAAGRVDAPVPIPADPPTPADGGAEVTPGAGATDDGAAVAPADSQSDGAAAPQDGGVAGPEAGGPPAPETEVPPATPSAASPPMGDYRMALVAAVNVDLPNQHPTVVLRETESPRRQLSFSIGFQDAVVLSHAMRRIPTPRPLTHELMSQVLQGFDIDVVAVRMVGRQGAVYFAELDLRGRTGRKILSCRPSDGLTVALLQPVSVPILIDRRLLELDGDVTPPGPGSTVS
jgi:uncharacterized protein